MELERAERMLKAQTAINKDLHLELEELSRRSTTDKKELQEKLEVSRAIRDPCKHGLQHSEGWPRQ
jgi:hypothetical protein